MMKKISTFLICLLSVMCLNAQLKRKQDRAAIKKMSGCFEVTFNFAETFNYSENKAYKPSDNKVSKGLEWAEIIEDEKNKISIQHLLIVGPKNRQSIVKHWRQDWLYQNTDFYTYNGNNEWLYKNTPKSDVKNQWTQKVYQVDDSPRYEGSGTWVHVDGKSYWENTTDAPLPRREYTKRNDYNITQRGNRHEITSFGWIHDQDNKKIIRTKNKQDVILAEEKGYNTYKKVADSKCNLAQTWWKENKANWSIVRNKWTAVFNKKQNLSLLKTVEKKPLFSYLFNDEYQFTEENIESTINSFVK